MRFGFWLAGLVWAGTAHAQPVLDAGAVPGLDAAGRASYGDWLLTNVPRAFAVGANGRMGWFSGGKTLDEARPRAIELCREHGGTACRVYAEDLSVVWPGRAWQPPPVPGPLVDTINYGFVPDERFLWHSPATARGVVVWSVGSVKPESGADVRGVQPPPYLRAFNDAGFDVVRFDRAPLVDNPVRAAGWLRDELLVLRRSGYRSIVAAGDSRGGWTSLQILDTAGLADVVVAIAPAAHGSGASPNLSAQVDDLRSLVRQAEQARTRVAVVQFSGDPFTADADASMQALQRLRPKMAALLLIDRPPGLGGHAAGIGASFARRFGPCLMHFAVDSIPPTACSDAEKPP